MSLIDKAIVAPAFDFDRIKPYDVLWLGRTPGERRLRVQVETRHEDGSLGVFFLGDTPGYGDLVQEPEEGAIHLRSPEGRLSKPLYVMEAA